MKRTKYQEQVAAAVESLGQRHPERRLLGAYDIACELRRIEGKGVAGVRAVNYKSIHALGEKGINWETRSCMVDRHNPFGRGFNGKRLDIEVFAINPHFIG